MGASVSTNVAKVATNSIVKIASDIIQDTHITSNSSQVISVTDNHGDVVINGNILKQKATINMQALFNAMSTEDVQQKLAVEIAQQAKSLTSGLNLAQFAASTNILTTLIKASIDISSKIGQTCMLNTNQNQSIIIERVQGTTNISNNVLDQMSDVLQNCITKAVTENKAIQEVTAKLTQSASASAIGLSEWSLVIIGAIIVGFPVVGGVYALKFIFPLIIVGGVVAIGYYIYSKKNFMKFTGFSSLIENSVNCSSILLRESNLNSVQIAADLCMKDDKCKALDFKAYNVTDTGLYEPLDKPVVKYYSDISCKDINPDGVNLVRIPIVFTGNNNPSDIENAVPGDVFINKKTSIWYQMDDTKVWRSKSTLILEEFTSINVSEFRPTSDTEGTGLLQYYIFYDNSLSYWHIYKKDIQKRRWLEQIKQPGPGVFTVVPVISNTTAFKTTEHKTWLLITGILAIIIGVIGMYKSFKNTSSSTK